MDLKAEPTLGRAGRFIAPARVAIDPSVWSRQPLAAWHDEFPWLQAEHFPAVADLNRWPDSSRWRFVEQSRELLADGLHYEQRIAERGKIATRADNWHDLFNALIWLRYPQLKAALNARQVQEIARMGPRVRSRSQCALTHFDEAGTIVVLRDPALLPLWDAHDWHSLFWCERDAWHDGRIHALIFGHALLEHALSPRQLLVGKAIAVRAGAVSNLEAVELVARAVVAEQSLRDPQELRPLPLSGIPGWHPESASEDFYRSAACFRPLRPGRRYPEPLSASS